MDLETTSIHKLCDAVRETAYKIHLDHGHGHLEKIYENALASRLRKAAIGDLISPDGL